MKSFKGVAEMYHCVDLYLSKQIGLGWINRIETYIDKQDICQDFLLQIILVIVLDSSNS